MTLSTKSVLQNQGRTNNVLALKRLNDNSMALAEALIAGKKPIEDSLPLAPEDGRTILHMGVPVYSKNGTWYYYSNNAEVGSGGTRFAPALQVSPVNGAFVLDRGIELEVGDHIAFTFTNFQALGTYTRFFSLEGFSATCGTDSSTGTSLRLTGCVGTLDGTPIATNITPVPTDSEPHTVGLIMTNPGTLFGVGGSVLELGGGISSAISATIYDLRVNNETFPLDEAWESYPTLAGSQGTNAIATNLTSADVVEVPLIERESLFTSPTVPVTWQDNGDGSYTKTGTDYGEIKQTLASPKNVEIRYISNVTGLSIKLDGVIEQADSLKGENILLASNVTTIAFGKSSIGGDISRITIVEV